MSPEQALEYIGGLVAGARVSAELAGGPASRSYLVERGDDRWVLRLDTPLAAELGLDRGAEARVLATVHMQGLGPRLDYLDVPAGIQLTRHVGGRAWTPSDLAEPANLDRLASLLRCVHRITVGRPFALRARVMRYADLVGSPEARRRAAAVAAILDGMAPGRVCLCHNDVVAQNVIDRDGVDGDGLVLVDWEYAALGDPFFDLAVVVRHHRLPADGATELLRAYAGRLRDRDERHLAAWCALYDHLLALWRCAVEAPAER